MSKILIVEDEVPIAHAYQIVLEQAGYQVKVATQAAQGLELAKADQPDLILLDVMMPDMTGLDMLKQLDLGKSLPHTKVIGLSNVESADIIDEALQLGATDFLRKVDFTPHQIVEVVKKHLSA